MKQFFANEIILIIVFVLLFIYGGSSSTAFVSSICLYGMLVLAVILIYRYAYLRNMKFIVTGEQLMYEHGVFHISRDFMELYRVIDFKEDSNLFQRFFGLKTIRIYSGDRSLPCLTIPGIHKSDNLVPFIRERVNLNRRINGIYEITNR